MHYHTVGHYTWHKLEMICYIMIVALSSPSFGEDLFLKETLHSVLEEMNVMKGILKNYESKMVELDNLKARTDALENEVANLKQENERLQRNVLQGDIDSNLVQEPKRKPDIKDEAVAHNKTQTDASTWMEGHLCRSRIYKRAISGHRVAFTAGIMSTDLHNLGEHQTIIFDTVLTNIGNAYHHNTGIFTVPFTGVYVITVTVTVRPGNVQWLELVVNGSVINFISAGPAAGNDYASTTKQWILQLNSGSEVLIRTDNSLQPDVHGNMNTMFSAFLLYDI